MTDLDTPVQLGGLQLLVSHLVPEGEAWLVDAKVLALERLPARAFRSGAQLVYLNPRTLAGLKDLLWAQQRTIASITYAELMATLETMKGRES